MALSPAMWSRTRLSTRSKASFAGNELDRLGELCASALVWVAQNYGCGILLEFHIQRGSSELPWAKAKQDLRRPVFFSNWRYQNAGFGRQSVAYELRVSVDIGKLISRRRKSETPDPLEIL